MTRPLAARSIAFLLVAFTMAGISYGSTPPKIVPAKGQKLSFKRTYTTDHLKNYPLQLVTKTDVVVKNTKGLLTATWNATFRDIRTDEKFDLSATGLCKAVGSRKLECAFDAATGTVIITARTGGILVSIPVGQGVLFSKEKDGVYRSELLFGADDEYNNTFVLNRI